MNLYAIIRRDGWTTPGDLGPPPPLVAVGDDEMPADIRWIRSYVLAKDSGNLGTVCIYEASSPEAIRDHASHADLRHRDHPDRRHGAGAAGSGGRVADPYA